MPFYRRSRGTRGVQRDAVYMDGFGIGGWMVHGIPFTMLFSLSRLDWPTDPFPSFSNQRRFSFLLLTFLFVSVMIFTTVQVD